MLLSRVTSEVDPEYKFCTTKPEAFLMPVHPSIVCRPMTSAICETNLRGDANAICLVIRRRAALMQVGMHKGRLNHLVPLSHLFAFGDQIQHRIHATYCDFFRVSTLSENVVSIPLSKTGPLTSYFKQIFLF